MKFCLTTFLERYIRDRENPLDFLTPVIVIPFAVYMVAASIKLDGVPQPIPMYKFSSNFSVYVYPKRMYS